MQKCEPRGGSASPRNAATQDKDDLPRLFYALYRKRGRRGGAVPKEIAPRPEGPNGEHGISARGERAAPRLGDLWPMVSSTDRSQRPTEVNIVFYIFSSLHRIRKIPTGHCDPAQTLTSWFPSDRLPGHATSVCPSRNDPCLRCPLGQTVWQRETRRSRCAPCLASLPPQRPKKTP